MSKRFLGLVLVFLLSACSSIIPEFNKKQASLTNNGSIILNNGDLSSFCSKESVEIYLSNAKQDGIKEEFNIKDYDTYLYSNNKKNYQNIAMPDKCQYKLYSFNYVDEDNSAFLTTVKLKKDEKVDFNKLHENNVIKNYIDNNRFSVNDILIKNKFKNITLNDLNNINIIAQDTAEYNIMMYPVFRFNYLEDNDKIYDYEFSSIGGISFKLVKK